MSSLAEVMYRVFARTMPHHAWNLHGGNRWPAATNRLLCVSRLDRLTFCTVKVWYAFLIFQGLHHGRCSFASLVTPRRARIDFT
ncbi:MAG: hypothetical protein KGQ60_10235 [Planctomycetes bacterium]|nr:hypothetical protein [Planctomycetota bacterium]